MNKCIHMKADSVPTSPHSVDLYYNALRTHFPEAPAALDRFDRTGTGEDPRVVRLRRAAEIAVGTEADRAVRFLEFLSVN